MALSKMGEKKKKRIVATKLPKMEGKKKKKRKEMLRPQHFLQQITRY